MFERVFFSVPSVGQLESDVHCIFQCEAGRKNPSLIPKIIYLRFSFYPETLFDEDLLFLFSISGASPSC